MNALRYGLVLWALGPIACNPQPVVALSSDVGPGLDAAVLDTGTPDSSLTDGLPRDLGANDLGFADAGQPDADQSDVPVGCMFPEVEQVGPAVVDELTSPNDTASMVLRPGADGVSFLLAYEFAPGPRSDEPFPVVRHYPRIGPAFAEVNVLSLIPTTGILDVQEGEPGFYHVAAGVNPVGAVGWNSLGADYAIEPGAGNAFGGGGFGPGSIFYFPVHSRTPGVSGQFEQLSLRRAELESSVSSTISLLDSGWSLGFDRPRLVVADNGELWIGTVQSWDFPPTIVGSYVDPASGQTLENVYGPSCGELVDYDLAIVGGIIGMVADCGPSTPGTKMTLGRGSFRTDQVILDGQAVAVPTRIGYNGSGVAVAVWEANQRSPAVRFYSGDGLPVSAGAIRLPVPSGIVAGDQPKAVTIAGIPGTSGGFSINTAAWGVAYAYQGVGGVRSFFARIGPCGTALPR